MFKRYEPPSQQLTLSFPELDIEDAILETFSNEDPNLNDFFQDTIQGQIIPNQEGEQDQPSPLPEFDNDTHIEINHDTVNDYFDGNNTILVENSYEDNDKRFVETFNIGLDLSKVIEQIEGVLVSNYIMVYFLKKFDDKPNDVNLLTLIIEIGKFSIK